MFDFRSPFPFSINPNPSPPDPPLVFGSRLLSHSESNWQAIHNRTLVNAENARIVEKSLQSLVNEVSSSANSYRSLALELASVDNLTRAVSELSVRVGILSHNLSLLDSALELVVDKREKELINSWKSNRDIQLAEQARNHERSEREARENQSINLGSLSKRLSGGQQTKTSSSSSSASSLTHFTSKMEAQVKNFMSVNIQKFVSKKSKQNPKVQENQQEEPVKSPASLYSEEVVQPSSSPVESPAEGSTSPQDTGINEENQTNSTEEEVAPIIQAESAESESTNIPPPSVSSSSSDISSSDVSPKTKKKTGKTDKPKGKGK